MYFEGLELIVAEGFGFAFGCDDVAFDEGGFFEFFEVDFSEGSAYADCVGDFVEVHFVLVLGESGDEAKAKWVA